MAISNILDITKCKKNDIITFRLQNDGTPASPEISIYDMDDTLISGPTTFDREDADYFYFLVDTSTLDEQTHYKIIIEDSTGLSRDEFLLYISGELTLENIIKRILGLSGNNIRIYSCTYTNGNMTSCKARIYETKAKLETADAGGTDDYLASYELEFTYDSEYNLSTIESKSE